MRTSVGTVHAQPCPPAVAAHLRRPHAACSPTFTWVHSFVMVKSMCFEKFVHYARGYKTQGVKARAWKSSSYCTACRDKCVVSHASGEKCVLSPIRAKTLQIRNFEFSNKEQARSCLWLQEKNSLAMDPRGSSLISINHVLTMSNRYLDRSNWSHHLQDRVCSVCTSILRMGCGSTNHYHHRPQHMHTSQRGCGTHMFNFRYQTPLQPPRDILLQHCTRCIQDPTEKSK